MVPMAVSSLATLPEPVDEVPGDKYRDKATIDAMRLAAWSPRMTFPDVNPEDLEVAFRLAPIDAAEPFYKALVQRLGNVIDTLGRGGLRAVDVGAGAGRLGFELARHDHVAEVVAIDHSPELVGELRMVAAGVERVVDVPFVPGRSMPALLSPPASAPRLRPLRGDALDLPVVDAEFDLAVSSGVLDRVPKPQDLVDQLHRVLVPGGYAFLAVIHDWKGSPAPRELHAYQPTTLFTPSRWTIIPPEAKDRWIPFVLREHAHLVEKFNVEIIIARKEAS